MNRKVVGHELAELMAGEARLGFAAGEACDVRLEQLFRDEIARRCPGDVVLGEEIETDAPWQGRGWIVDPIDGTNNFLSGVPFYCVSIAYVEDGQPTLGWVVDPERRETWHAAAGGGVRCNSEVVGVVEEQRESKPLVVISSRWRKRNKVAATRLREHVRERSFGALALECAWAAGGRATAGIWGSARVWDLAAGVLLVREGGGYVEECGGGEVHLHDAGIRSQRFSFHAGSPLLQPLLREHSSGED